MKQVQMTPVHFLLVDDLEENLLSLEALLRRDNLVLLKAKSGQDALELLLQYDVGLALLDVQMPGMDGFELAELMRGTERTRNIPIIFLTAGTTDRQRRFRGYEAGAVDFLQKPIETDILKSKAGIFYELNYQQRLLTLQRDAIKQQADENARLLEESRVHARTLQDMDKRKDEFLATLAHELRNPLAPVRNGIQILKMSPSEETAIKIRDIMDRQLTHLVRLIDDLLDVSRISQGKIILQKSRIPVRTVVEAAVEATAPIIEEKKHTLTINLPDEDLWVDGDLTRLDQVVSNLLNNAAKYTPSGGTIILSARKKNGQAVISVADSGCGIAPEMQAKVFELFAQVNDSLDKSQGGLGIGLALAQQLIDMHGGTIQAESAGLGKGSIFRVALPLMQQEEAKEENPDIADKTTIAPISALVVDDNVASAQTMGWMLESAGHTALLAHSGLQAIEVAKASKPDVILLDIGMPGMNGYDTCRELRKEPSLKNAVFIAQTGWGQERDRALAVEAGFHHHLVKPVKYDDFLALIAKIQNNLVA